MPRYDYECEDGHVFEADAGYDDDEIQCEVPIAEDDFCSKPAHRQIPTADSNIGIIIK